MLRYSATCLPLLSFIQHEKPKSPACDDAFTRYSRQAFCASSGPDRNEGHWADSSDKKKNIIVREFRDEVQHLPAPHLPIPTPARCPAEIALHNLDVFKFYPSHKLPSFSNLRISRSHLASINYRTRLPDWVAEKITQAGINGSGDRAYSNFVVDDSIPELWRIRNEDFRLSGYERGHLAPAASHRNDQVKETVPNRVSQ